MRINTLFKANFVLRVFGLFKIPVIGFVNPKLIQLDDEKCILRIKLKRRTKNHLNSMYLGVLAVGADLACGMLGLYHIQESGKNISLVFKDMKADFLKRPDQDVDFMCTQGAEVKKMVEIAINTGERQSIPLKIEAKCKGDIVSEFTLTLSLKYRSK
ncbi:MAG: YiiD C-terminal domain-containing protein [Candidatus Marinimicrobia bacterium]|nr:YiiD C-terminal domain-containing protein [Candidatus Neomarinimicrobiota bacterium]